MSRLYFRNAAHLTELILHFLDPAKFWGISCDSVWLSFCFLIVLLVFILKRISDISLKPDKTAAEISSNTFTPSDKKKKILQVLTIISYNSFLFVPPILSKN